MGIYGVSRILDLLCDCGVDTQMSDGFLLVISEAEALKTISYYSMGSLHLCLYFCHTTKKMVRPIWANVLNSCTSNNNSSHYLPVPFSTGV